jgi:hypothetical protein
MKPVKLYGNFSLQVSLAVKFYGLKASTKLAWLCSVSEVKEGVITMKCDN